MTLADSAAWFALGFILGLFFAVYQFTRAARENPDEIVNAVYQAAEADAKHLRR